MVQQYPKTDHHHISQHSYQIISTVSITTDQWCGICCR